MFRLIALFLFAGLLSAQEKPKLVVAITVDQLRQDYLTRFRGEFRGGLERMLTQGAVFTNAHYEHFPTVTAIGHSTFMSGATPSVSGIIGNDWFDRDTGKTVTSVSDDETQLLGAKGKGSSPRRMLVSTVSDELKLASQGKSKVIGISIKDRAAILPAGHMADAAYWVERKSATVLSSTYYFNDLPGWVKQFNAQRSVARYAGQVWDLTPYGGTKRTMPAADDPKFGDTVAMSPFGNDMLLDFLETAVDAEKLGQRGVTDLLAVSFSSNDVVGHEWGPDYPEVRSITVATDRQFERLFRFLDERVGMRNVLVVLTADHGVAPVPEVNQARKMPGGRMPAKVIQETVTRRLTEEFGEGKWILSPSDHSLYFNRQLIAEKKLRLEQVQDVALAAALSVPRVARVYTSEQLTRGTAMADIVSRRVRNGYHETRGADLMIVLEPYWMYSSSGTTHGSPYNYDSHVPVIFMGPGIRTGVYRRTIAVNDIAPTLAELLEVETPSGSAGRVLAEIFQRSTSEPLSGGH
ncbi:MAG: alkaline phosphatase family protein [Bryobacterales bacterium]|nr:alkaline phosphatase family protein [Bryobacterales bacterium]